MEHRRHPVCLSPPATLFPMCGRYVRKSDKQRIADTFHVRDVPSSLVLPEWDYNVAPTTFQPVIRNAAETGERELLLMRWGLVPFFTKQLSDVKGVSTINARAETVEKSPTWRAPFQKRRCLVPADAFYEWKQTEDVQEKGPRTGKHGKTRQPYAFTLRDRAPFAFAGLWDAWKAPDGAWLQSFSIITTEANELMTPIHTRMPVVLHPRDYDRWLERDGERGGDRRAAQLPIRPPIDLLRPFESDAMLSYPCNPLVGNVRNNGPELLDRA